MFNLDFQSCFPNYNVSHLTRICSDHAPLWFRFQVDSAKTHGGFIFQTMLVEHPSFLDVVAQNWDAPMHGTPGQTFAKKLIGLRRELKRWNWESFGYIRRKKQDLNTRIQALERRGGHRVG